MDFDNQQKVRDNSWAQQSSEANGLIKAIAGVLAAIFAIWLLVSFAPFLFSIGDLLKSGYGAHQIFQNHIYWLTFILMLLAAIFLWGKQTSGYLIATGASGFLLAMRFVSGLFYVLKYGTSLLDFAAGLIGIHFPVSIYTPINVAVTAGIIFTFVQVNRTHVRAALRVDNQTKGMALLLGVGLLLYASFTMVFADILFPPEYLGFEF